MANIRPLENDPGRERIRDAFDMNSDEWWLTDAGDYTAMWMMEHEQEAD